MALVIPPGYAQCSIEITNAGDPEPWYVTHGVSTTAAGGDYPAVGASVMGAFGAAWQSFLSTGSRISGVYLTVGSDGGNYTLYVTPDVAIIGTSTAEKLPQNCAYLIQKQTLRPGRAGKGRCFLPNVAPEGQVDNVGVISPTSLVSGQEACDLWLDTLASEVPVETPMFLLHNQGIPSGTTPDSVFRLQLDTRIATQRRRLRR